MATSLCLPATYKRRPYLFRGQWNNHYGLSTENGKSPTQLFVLGMLTNHTSQLTAVRDVFDSHGVPASVEATTVPANTAQVLGRTRVDVPGIECPLSEEQQQTVRDNVNPLEESTDHGMALYIQARQSVM